MIERPLYRAAWEELSAEKSMVFLAGPRQVGKTTLGNWIAGAFRNRTAINWDVADDRPRIIRQRYFSAASYPTVVDLTIRLGPGGLREGMSPAQGGSP